jgi:hypothetical protein
MIYYDLLPGSLNILTTGNKDVLLAPWREHARARNVSTVNKESATRAYTADKSREARQETRIKVTRMTFVPVDVD